jgi:hypothetical protein
MQQVLRLNWPVCRDGYDLVKFDSRKVDWPLFLRTEEARQSQLTDQEQRFLERWGERLSLNDPGEEEELWFMPRSKRISTFDVLAKEPRLYSKLAGARGSDVKLQKFVSDYGLLWQNEPCSLAHLRACASRLHDLMEMRNVVDRRRKFEWLTAAMKNFNGGFSSDINFSPEVVNNRVEFILRPEDLRIALMVQLIFSGSKNLKVNQCANCGNFIPKGPKQYRQDRKHCSDACRQQAYRQASCRKRK